MKKIYLFTIAFTMMTFLAIGQDKKFINFDDCKPKNEMFVKAESVPTWTLNPDSINDYFQQVLSKSTKMKRLTGKVTLAILINEKGEACLNSFLDHDNKGFISEEFRLAIRNMSNWNPALQRGKAVTFNKIILLQIRKGKIINTAN